jgi:hypothetical protein
VFVVFYGSYTLKGKLGLKVSENIVLRRIFGEKRDEDRRLKKNLCEMKSFESFTHLQISGQSIEGRDLWGISTLGQGDKCIHNFVGSPEEVTPFRRPRHGWEVNRNIKMYQGSRVGGCRLD